MRLDIARVDGYVLRLLLHKVRLALMIITPQSCPLLFQYERNGTKPKHYPKRNHWLLTQLRRRSICLRPQLLYSISLLHININNQRWSLQNLLSAAHLIIGITVVPHACLNSGTSLPHISPPLANSLEIVDEGLITRCVTGRHLDAPHRQYWSVTVHRNQMATHAVRKWQWRAGLMVAAPLFVIWSCPR